MRVGVAHQPVAVERRAHPVHRRVRGEPGLDREDMFGQIEVAVGDRVEPRFGAQNGEPRRPDVRGHQVAPRPGVQRDLQQVARVEAENGAAVGRQVPDLGQGGGDCARRLECGGINKVVDLPGHPVALVDGGDLGREQEAHLRLAAGRGGPSQLRLEVRAEAEQARLGRLERLGEFGGPGRVGEVAGADHADALARRPPGQRLGVAVLAAGAGEARVDVQVGVKHAARSCHAPVTPGPGSRRAARRVAP